MNRYIVLIVLISSLSSSQRILSQVVGYIMIRYIVMGEENRQGRRQMQPKLCSQFAYSKYDYCVNYATSSLKQAYDFCLYSNYQQYDNCEQRVTQVDWKYIERQLLSGQTNQYGQTPS